MGEFNSDNEIVSCKNDDYGRTLEDLIIQNAISLENAKRNVEWNMRMTLLSDSNVPDGMKKEIMYNMRLF
jgi:hypothetical protein